MLLQVGDVLVLAGGVDDHEEVVLAAGDHQVIEDAALLVGEQGVALLENRQVHDVDRDEEFERHVGAVALEQDLAHVGHVEQAGGGTGVLVFGEDAGGVLHGHVVAPEGNHLGAEFDVQGVQGRLEQVSGHGCVWRRGQWRAI